MWGAAGVGTNFWSITQDQPSDESGHVSPSKSSRSRSRAREWGPLPCGAGLRLKGRRCEQGMTECFFLDGLLPVHLPARPGSSPSHTEPYLSLVMPCDGGTRRLALPAAREGRTRGARARPRLRPRLGAHLNVRPRPEPRAHTYRRLGGRRAAFWRGAQRRRAQLAGRLRSGGAVPFAPVPLPLGRSPTPPPARQSQPTIPRRQGGAAPGAPSRPPSWAARAPRLPGAT